MGGIRKKGGMSLMGKFKSMGQEVVDARQASEGNAVMPLPDDDVASLTRRKARSGTRRRGGRISTIFGESEGLGG